MFFALWPPDAVREELARVASVVPPGSAARAHRVKPERFHLTLAFLGEIDKAQADAAMQAASSVVAAPFDLVFDTVGHFARAGVAWLGPHELCSGLAQLKAELDRELLRFGLPVESGAYTPHLTCLRGVRDAPDALPFRIDWPVAEFVLVRSVVKAGVSGYEVVRRWPLRREWGASRPSGE
jgi:2'-5' RNA ligase